MTRRLLFLAISMVIRVSDTDASQILFLAVRTMSEGVEVKAGAATVEDGITARLDLAAAPWLEPVYWQYLGSRLSPDGTRMLGLLAPGEELRADIYVANTDGSERVVLGHTDGEGCYRWSPDGTQVVYDTGPTGQREIYIASADGSRQINLSRNVADDYNPFWSPDGRTIVFVSERDGNSEIYQMTADGTGQANLSNSALEDWLPAWSPQGPWSPDGSRLVFISRRSGNPDVYIMDAGGTDPVQLTDNMEADVDPVWSPDGTMVAFVRSFIVGMRIMGDIYVATADGSSEFPITETADTNEAYPVWLDMNLAPSAVRGTSWGSVKSAVNGNDER